MTESGVLRRESPLSTGGCTSQVFAATRPDRLLGLVLADASVTEVPGAGHASNLLNPGFLAEALAEFLEPIEV
jgi:pimeloyl-ACP methyl ester carboxylesterase